MRTLNCLYDTPQRLTEAAAAHGIEDGPGLLLLAFTAREDPAFIAGLQRELGACFPQALLLGATSAGSTCDGRLHPDRTVVSLCLFEETRLHLVEVDADDTHSAEAGEQLGDALNAIGARAALLLAAGPGIDGDALARGIEQRARAVAVCGVLAAAPGLRPQPCVFTRERIIVDGAATAAFVNPQLRVHSHYSLGWVPLGRELDVTRAEGNRVHAIENAPALDIYEHYLSAAAAADIHQTGILFPLMTERHGVLLARACTGTGEDRSIRLMGNVHPGEKVRFGVFDPDTYLDTVNRNLTRLKGFRPEAVFAFPCMTRRMLMPELLDAEFAQMQGIAPTVAALGFGEFFHRPRQNLFFNFTSTVLALAESEASAEAMEAVHLAPRLARSELQLRVLSHLVNVTARELEAANAALEVLASTDMLTEAWNRRQMQSLLEEELLRSERYREPLAVVLFDIDDFKAVNDGHGHQAGDRVLREVADVARDVMRRTDQLGRWGGEEFLVLCIGTERAGAQELAERLREAVAEHRFSEEIRLTVSLGVAAHRGGESADALVQRADEGLYRSKAAGKNRNTLVG